MASPAFAEISKLIKYDPASGSLTWLPRTPSQFSSGAQTRERACNIWNAKFAWKEALGAHSNGYRMGSINYRKYQAHRVCWLLHYGQWPTGHIDHINGVKSDNRIENLRDVSATENAKNAKTPCHNTSGFIGVSWSKVAKKWRANIKVNQRQISIGYFSAKEDAIQARKLAEEKYGFHPNHGRKEI